jgi:DNA mismatch repair protein MutS
MYITMSNEDLTPVRQQYLEIKKQYPNTILFFRLGDFYETFDQDAEITSRELDIVLTSRPVAKGVRAPLAGIPYHAVENYLARLVEKGYHVAICEQVGDQPVKGIFPRKVVRVVTPGTIDEPNLLQGDRNNYLASFCISDKHAGIAYVDITTGEFTATEINGDDLISLLRAELLRINPAEILHPESNTFLNGFPGHLTPYADWHFEINRCEDSLLRQFRVSALDGFGLSTLPLAKQAAGVLVQYLQDTQPLALQLLTSLSTYSLSEFMNLDPATRRNLELTETIRTGEVLGSLLGVLDQTITSMGKRLLRQWVSKPLLNIETISKRQQGVKFFHLNGMVRASLRSALHFLSDMERLSSRVLAGRALPRDLVALRSTLRVLPKFIDILRDHQNELEDYFRQLNPCSMELSLLENSIDSDPPATLANIGIIKTGYSAELDGVIEASKHAREWIANLESIERERTGIKSLKVGYNKVFGYYIEVTHSNTNNVPSEYIRKQTLVNAERYITPEMKEYETLVLNAEEQIHQLEVEIFRQICSQLAEASPQLLVTARVIAELDVLASLAEVAAINNYIQPVVSEDTILEIRDGRHPVVEQSLSGERFVPNDSVFEQGELVRLITGPNMSGKSTFLRQVALIILMAQMGSFVPASSAKIGLVDRIFTRIGAQDEIHAGHSTFMVEMIETANILHHATSRSLIILDEIGRGTSTYDGVSIAWAVVEYIHNHPLLRARTLFATHYHELTQLSELLPGIRNYNVAVSESEGKVVFLHKIISGGTDRSYGIHVAQLAGLPGPVIQRANEILQQLEASSGHAGRFNTALPQQMALFPETNPLLEELKSLDLNALSPLEALNKLYEWSRKFYVN